MNGHFQTYSTQEKIENLTAQIPQALRARAFAETMPEDGNIHTFERKLTGFVIWSLPALIEQERQAAEVASDNEIFSTGLEMDGAETGVSQEVVI